MAGERPKPKKDPPAASSSEEQSSSTEGQGEEDSSSQEQEDQPAVAKITPKPFINKPESHSDSDDDEEETQQPPAQLKPPAAKQDSDPDSGSKTKSDTKHPKQTNAGYIKHAAKKPRQETPKKPSSDSPLAKAAKKGSKKADSESQQHGDKSEDKKHLFQRLFSEEDEVTLLEGLIEFESANGNNPSKNMNAFHNFIRKSLNFDASVAQLSNKIDNLKRKLRKNLKSGKLGEDSNLSNPHEKKVFDLSKKLWGGVKDAGKKTKKLDGMDIDGVRNYFGTDMDMMVGEVTEEFVLRRGLDLVDRAKRAEMEEKWRKLHVASLELLLQRRELIGEQAKLLLKAFKSGKE